MKRLANGIRGTFDSALFRAKDAAGRIARERLYGSSGQSESLAHGTYSGTQTGAPVTLALKASAVANVLRQEMNASGVTLTLRTYKRIGENFVLWDVGVVDTGMTTFKGNAAEGKMPAIGLEATGEWKFEVETSAPLRYAVAAEA
jgi:hypothetical protein